MIAGKYDAERSWVYGGAFAALTRTDWMTGRTELSAKWRECFASTRYRHIGTVRAYQLDRLGYDGEVNAGGLTFQRELIQKALMVAKSDGATAPIHVAIAEWDGLSVMRLHRYPFTAWIAPLSGVKVAVELVA